MEQGLFERPREKLQHVGVGVLTNAELLQIIIGSGTAHMPVAKIARSINEELLRLNKNLSYKTLFSIPGVGAANASRVIASIELGKRLQQNNTRLQELDTTQVQRSRRKSVLYVTLDGNGSPVQTTIEQLKPGTSAAVLSRRLCAKVLSNNAWGISVAIGSAKAEDQPGTFELALVSDLQQLAQRLQIKLISIQYVSRLKQQYMYKAST